MKTLISKVICCAGVVFVTTVASAQNYAIDWHSINGGGGTSTGGLFSLNGTIGQPDAGNMSGGSFELTGGFWSLDSNKSPIVPIVIFDNSSGSFNGQSFASTTAWHAGKFCLGSQAYALDSVTLFLNSGDGSGQPHESNVRLQIFSHDPITGRPSATTGSTMNLSGVTNPITLAAGNISTPFKWIPSTPFNLLADECYWVVLSVDSGAIAYQVATVSMPTGDAAAYGRSSSANGGTSWFVPDLTSNWKMQILGTPSAPPPPLNITAINYSENALRFSFPAHSEQSYVIEGRTNLVSGDWEEVPVTDAIHNGTSFQVAISNVFNRPQQFYRVKLLP